MTENLAFTLTSGAALNNPPCRAAEAGTKAGNADTSDDEGDAAAKAEAEADEEDASGLLRVSANFRDMITDQVGSGVFASVSVLQCPPYTHGCPDLAQSVYHLPVMLTCACGQMLSLVKHFRIPHDELWPLDIAKFFFVHAFVVAVPAAGAPGA